MVELAFDKHGFGLCIKSNTIVSVNMLKNPVQLLLSGDDLHTPLVLIEWKRNDFLFRYCRLELQEFLMNC